MAGNFYFEFVKHVICSELFFLMHKKRGGGGEMHEKEMRRIRK
jgi:hypothetical protein